jgi:predicted nicotinamide N-methyase
LMVVELIRALNAELGQALYPREIFEEMREQLADYARDFSFEVSTLDPAPSVNVRLNDGLAGTNSSEPDDVGLQSWGASIIVSRLLCAHPDRFGLTKTLLGDAPLIVELGAGTGLVSLVLHDLLPHLGVPSPTIVATDYHPAVLDNLRRNVTANIPEEHQQRIHTRTLDWSNPTPAFETPPLDAPADILIATDVIYALEHAIWLRDCASRLLGPDGVFWLVATVRQNGRFEGVSATVEAAFADADRPRDSKGRRLTIVQAEKLEKLVGIGRADESGYKVFRIEWA